MNIIIKKTIALITLASVVCLNACADKSAEKEKASEKPQPTAVIAQQEENSLKRTVEIDRGNGYSDTYEFNEKGLLVKEDFYSGCKYGYEWNNFRYITEYEYDENDRITRYSTTHSNGNVDYFLSNTMKTAE